MNYLIFHAKNGELEEILVKIKSIMDGEIILPVRVSYKIVKNGLAIEKALTAYRMTKDDIINRYSNGTGQISEKENPDVFKKVLEDITVISNEYTDIEVAMITVDELGDRELPLSAVSALGFMME